VAPVLESLGAAPAREDVKAAFALAVAVWNAEVAASRLWGDVNPEARDALRASVRESPQRAAAFDLLSARWRKDHWTEARLVGACSLDVDPDGTPRFTCRTEYPEGVFPETKPPIEKRIAIGGRFLDEVLFRSSDTTGFSYPVENHRGVVGDDGRVTIVTKAGTALQLFADGALRAVGSAVEVSVGGRALGPMTLVSVRGSGGLGDDAVTLVFGAAR
jgi:hypothetical protein